MVLKFFKMKEKKALGGKILAERMQIELARRVGLLKEKFPKLPIFAIVLVGDDPSSLVYISRKIEVAKKLGIEAKLIKLPHNSTQGDIVNEVQKANNSPEISGIIVQMPLPEHINSLEICNLISANKDIDGLCAENAGKLALGFNFADISHLPCTPSACIYLLESNGILLKSKRCLVINRSNIVGKPLANMLLRQDAIVQISHSRDENISELTRAADVIFSAVGVPKFITSDMMKSGSVLVDIGISRGFDGKIAGDIDESCAKIASFISPVPGGVGPLTIAFLMKNIVKSMENYCNSLM